MRMAGKAASWDDEDSTLDGVSDSPINRENLPKSQLHHHTAVSESKKTSLAVPRTIDAFVETEEEVREQIIFVNGIIVSRTINSTLLRSCNAQLSMSSIKRMSQTQNRVWMPIWRF